MDGETGKPWGYDSSQQFPFLKSFKLKTMKNMKSFKLKTMKNMKKRNDLKYKVNHANTYRYKTSSVPHMQMLLNEDVK